MSERVQLQPLSESFTTAAADNLTLNDCLLTGPPFSMICVQSFYISAHTIMPFRLTLRRPSSTSIFMRKAETALSFSGFAILQIPTVSLFTSVFFEAVSSPFILYATLCHHLQQYNTPLFHNIQSNLYVDNIISGCETEIQKVKYYHKARGIMSSVKFTANS